MLQETGSSTRREFARNALQSATALALIEGLWSSRLFGDGVRPLLDDWFKEVDAISKDVHDHKIERRRVPEVARKAVRAVDSADRCLNLSTSTGLPGRVTFPAKGAKSFSGDDLHMTGLPQKPVFGRQVFAMKKGRSVVPHGHDNMATGFLVLKGNFRGRHYDRVEDHSDHYVIRPTIDRVFKPGEFSTISDHKDNIHWFTAEERDRLHLQRPRGRDRSRKQEEAGASLRRPDGRKTRRRPDQGRQDHVREGQSALRLMSRRLRLMTGQPGVSALRFTAATRTTASRLRRELRGCGE